MKHNPGWVYVEHAIELPDDETVFRSYLAYGESTAEVQAAAERNAREAHPDALTIDFFMSRRLTAERAAKIRQAFEDGTWSEWFADMGSI